MDRTNRRRQILATRGERDQGAEPTHDILIAVVDGLKGFPEAITAVFPETVVQTCIVHPIRYSTQFASWNELKPIAAALKPIYRANNAGTTAHELEAFDQSLRPEGSPPGGHDQRDQEPQCLGPKGDPRQRPFPERSGRHRADLAGAATHHRELEEPAHHVARCKSTTRYPVRRTLHADRLITPTGSHTEFLTVPVAQV